jgi:hypothetical protein
VNRRRVAIENAGSHLACKSAKSERPSGGTKAAHAEPVKSLLSIAVLVLVSSAVGCAPYRQGARSCSPCGSRCSSGQTAVDGVVSVFQLIGAVAELSRVAEGSSADASVELDVEVKTSGKSGQRR